MTTATWNITDTAARGLGKFAGCNVIRRPDGWWLVDVRGDKPRASGPHVLMCQAIDRAKPQEASR
jgi:hypothetical protein